MNPPPTSPMTRDRRQWPLAAISMAILLSLVAGGAAYWRFGCAVEVSVVVAAKSTIAARVVGPGAVQARIPVTLSARVSATVTQVLVADLRRLRGNHARACMATGFR